MTSIDLTEEPLLDFPLPILSPLQMITCKTTNAAEEFPLSLKMVKKTLTVSPSKEMTINGLFAPNILKKSTHSEVNSF